MIIFPATTKVLDTDCGRMEAAVVVNIYAPFKSALLPLADAGTPGLSNTIVIPPGVVSDTFTSPAHVCSRGGVVPVSVPKVSVTDNLLAASKRNPLLTAIVLEIPIGLLSGMARLIEPEENVVLKVPPDEFTVNTMGSPSQIGEDEVAKELITGNGLALTTALAFVVQLLESVTNTV